MQLSIKNHRFYVATEDEDAIALLGLIPGSRMLQSGVTFPMERSVIQAVTDLVPMDVAPEVLQWENDVRTTMMESARALLATDVDVAKFRYENAHLLYPHQRVGVRWLLLRGESNVKMLADMPGLGKTVQAIVAVEELGTAAPSVLVVCKENVTAQQWVDAIKKWAPKRTYELCVDGSLASRNKKILAAIRARTRYIIVKQSCLRHPGSASKHHEAACPAIFQARWPVVIVDEAHEYPYNHGKPSRQVNGLLMLMRQTDRMWLVTGTVVWGAVNSLYMYLRMIHPHRYGSFWSFAHEFCTVQTTPFGQKVLPPRPRSAKMNALKKELAVHVLRREDADVSNALPPVIHETIHIEMDPEVRALYKTLRKKSTQVADIVGKTSVLRAMRLLCCAPSLIDKENPLLRRLKEPKTEALLDVVRGHILTGHRVLVLAWHVSYVEHLADAITKEVGVAVETITGKVAAQKRVESVTRFKAGISSVLVATLKTMGVGIDLPGVQAVIMAEMDFVPAVNEQGWRRAYRLNSKTLLRVYRLITTKSVEAKIAALADARSDLADEVLAVRHIVEALAGEEN